MYRIGLSISSISDQMYANLRSSGIEALELSFPKQGHDDYDLKLARTLSDKNDLLLWSYHLPVMPIDIAADQHSEKSVAYLSEVIRRVGEIGIEKMVIHPGYEPIADHERAERLKCSCQSLSRLADVAAEVGSVICLEDLPRTCMGRDSEEILTMLNADSRLRACFDTNHIMREPVEDYMRKIGSKIVTLHVSDYDDINERHWLPGEGKNDWPMIVDILEEIGYDGVWMYEVGFGIPKTILRPRALTCADFVRNAEEVLNRRPITVISQPKPGVGMWE